MKIGEVLLRLVSNYVRPVASVRLSQIIRTDDSKCKLGLIRYRQTNILPAIRDHKDYGIIHYSEFGNGFNTVINKKGSNRSFC